MSSSCKDVIRFQPEHSGLPEFNVVLDENMTHEQFHFTLIRRKKEFLKNLKDVCDISFKDIVFRSGYGWEKGAYIYEKSIFNYYKKYRERKLDWVGVIPDEIDAGVGGQSPRNTQEKDKGGTKKLTLDETKEVVRTIVLLFAPRMNTKEQDDLKNSDSIMYKYDTSRHCRQRTKMEACIKEVCDRKIKRELENAAKMCHVKFVMEELEQCKTNFEYRLTSSATGCEAWYTNYGKHLEAAYNEVCGEHLSIVDRMEDVMVRSVPSWISGHDFGYFMSIDPEQTAFANTIELISNGDKPENTQRAYANGHLVSMHATYRNELIDSQKEKVVLAQEDVRIAREQHYLQFDKCNKLESEYKELKKKYEDLKRKRKR